MPLHLQHHKSYHPYNKDNIARVQRDELEAQVQDEARRQQAREAEAEARIESLRKRQRQAGGDGTSTEGQARPEKRMARGLQSSKEQAAGPSFPQGNPDYEAEQKVQRAEAQQQVAMYLGKPAKELQPWYQNKDLQSGRERKRTQEQRLEAAYKDSMVKSSSDPLLAMNAYLDERKKVQDARQAARQAARDKAQGSLAFHIDETPRPHGYNDQFYRDDVRAAKMRHQDSERTNEQDFQVRPEIDDPGPMTEMAVSGTADEMTKSAALAEVKEIEKGTEIATTGDVEAPPMVAAQDEARKGKGDEMVMGTVETKRGTDIATGQATIDEEAADVARPSAAPVQSLEAGIQNRRDSADTRSMQKSASTDSIESTSSTDSIESTDSRGRPRESMYPLLLGEMIDTVLDAEAYLFSAQEIELLRSFTVQDYEARHLFARLIQRRSTWHRVDKLNYDFDVKDKEKAVATLCTPLNTKESAEDGVESVDLRRLCLSELDMDGGDEEALNMMTLEELKILAKSMNRLKGLTTKNAIISALLTTKSQGTLHAFASSGASVQRSQSAVLREQLGEMMGGCIRVNPAAQALIDRVSLVYYRCAEIGGSALTTAVLSRSRKRTYPLYEYKRSKDIFGSRQQLLDMQRALTLEIQMDQWIEWDGSPSAIHKALEAFEIIYEEWKAAVEEGQHLLENATKAFERTMYNRMRFHPGWPLTRVVYKGVYILGRLHRHEQEAEVLRRLLAQRAFRRGRRGDWYDRLALITAQYPPSQQAHVVRKAKRDALAISVQGIEDSDTHLIYHDTLQRRIMRLESQLKLPFSEKHDFSYAKLRQCQDRIFTGTRLDRMQGEVKGIFGVSITPGDDRRIKAAKARGSNGTSSGDSSFEGDAFTHRKPLRKVVKVEKQASRLSSASPDKSRESTPAMESVDVIQARASAVDDASYSVERRDVRKDMHSVWRGLDGEPCRVETLVLQHYYQDGYKGFHCEGGVLMMLFALLMWDIIFMPLDGVFETAYQRQPLDLQEDSFSVVRGPEIRQRLIEVEATGGLHLIRETDERERERKTWAVGCRWQAYSQEDLLEIAECMGGHALSIVCQMFCEEFGHCTAGMPDLVVWRFHDKQVRFCEVKGPGDKLSDKQKLWIDVLLRAGLHVEVSKVEEGRPLRA